MPDLDPAHIRKRPGMYIGGTGPAGVGRYVMEVVSNSFDIVLDERATTITVSFDADGAVTVHDDGPGMVVVDRAGPTFEQLFTTFHKTPTADGHFPHLHLAIGVGLGPICALSSELDVTVHRADATYRQSFSRGEVVSQLERSAPTGVTGTTIRLVPDPTMFEATARGAIEPIADDLRELAHLHPGLTTRLEVAGRDPLVFGPHADLVPLFEHAFPADGPGFATPEPLVLSAMTDDFAVDALLTWSTHRWEVELVAYGNYRRLYEPQRVEQGVEEGLRLALGDGPLVDAMAGLRGVVHVRLLDPAFPGPTARRLTSPEAIWCIADTVAEQLPGQLARHPELDADLRSRIPTRTNVAAGAYEDDELRERRKTPI